METQQGNDNVDKEDPIPSEQPNDDLILSFEYLTVHIPGSGWKCCTCLDSSLSKFSQEYMGMSVDKVEPFYAISNISGYIRTGETCLILGPSGSGKSTLLRTLCGRLSDTDELHGTLMLNGIPLGNKSSVRGWRQMSSYVSASDASHSPVMTVAETIQFAAECHSDGKSSKQQIEKRVQNMLGVLGLAHVSDTVVGDENLRGVSGGQKRRVTVGEMLMNPNAKFICCDNITDGLASTDSLALIQNISKACKKFRIAAVISLLQPSDEIVSQFDKMLVLSNKGEMNYFGPVNRSLLRQCFLGSDDPSRDKGAICDLVMDQSMEVNSFSKKTIEDHAVQRFNVSKEYDDLVRDLAQIRREAPPPHKCDAFLKNLLPSDKYSTPYFYQFKIIAKRRIKLILRNAMTYSRVIIAILFGFIVGSLFSALNQDIVGSLGRTGYLFLNCFLVLMLSAAVTIPDIFRQRSTLFKHRSSEFFSAKVYYIVQVILDIPLSIFEATLMASISYFWASMNSGANHFFFYLGVLIGLEFVGQAFARFNSAINRIQTAANTMSSLYIFMCGAVSGFMPTYSAIPWIFRWASWLSPVSYAFEAIMINEFDGRTMSGVVITKDDGTTDLGTLEGSDWLQIFDLPRGGWGTKTQVKFFDLGMLFVFAFAFDCLGFCYNELTRKWYHNQIRRSRAMVHQKDINPKREDGQVQVNIEEPQEDSNGWPQSLSVKNLSYTVPIGKSKQYTIQALLGPSLMKCMGKKIPEKNDSKNEITLINCVSARFKRGRMTALMGQSGAGKTTLMDVIAGYKTGGKISGDIMIDGHPKQENIWKKISGYAEQNDILNPYFSVLETLQFTAACRLPSDVDKDSIISHVITLMGLDAYTNMVVGREKEGEGLPKHARKRLTIANQLVIKPKVLFLDEPTSGLGCNAAALVIGAVRRSTDALGLITLATIHQPSRQMFEAFDDLLLLAKGGRVAYIGPLGPDSELVMNYFASLSGTEPPSCNPADYVLDVVDKCSADVAVSAFQTSTQCSTLDSEIEADIKQKNTIGKNPDTAITANNDSLKFSKELALVFKRQIISEWRNPSYAFMRMSVSIFASLFLGILFFQIEPNIKGATFAIAAIFYLVFVLVVPMQAAVIPLIEDRAVQYRETVSGTYSRFAYGLGQLFADIPFHILNTFLMFISIYYLVGFRTGGEVVGYFILMLFLANWLVTSLGQLFALVTPNEESANGGAGLIVILSVIFMGFLIPANAMPTGWVWAYWSNMFHYILQGLVTNEISGQSYHFDLVGDIGSSSTNQTIPSSAVLFDSNHEPSDDNIAAQAANLMGLTIHAISGNNTNAGLGSLTALVGCMVENKCLVDPFLQNFISCNIIGIRRPPCADEYDNAISSIDTKQIAQCFLPDFGPSNYSARGVPDNFSNEGFVKLAESSQIDLVTCLFRAVLPPGVGEAVKMIAKIFDRLYGIAMFVIDIIQNGIDIPGNLILFYFGWAEFTGDEIVAPFKWYYCMTAVAVFLVSFEIFKLIAVRFIVWTKR